MVSDEARRARALQREERQRALEARQDALEVRLQAVAADADQAKRSADSQSYQSLVDRLNRLEAKLGAAGESGGDWNRTAEALKARVVAAEGELKRMRHVLGEVLTVYDDLQDRLYEVDRSWHNNLIFHGVRPFHSGGRHALETNDEIEARIKHLLRSRLNIGRDMVINRCHRIHTGVENRGIRPIVVSFYKWSDKEAVFRKSKLLRDSGIVVEEDFSRAAKRRRKELQKVEREVKAIDPNTKCMFKYDKLLVNDVTLIFNEATQRVERQPSLSAFDPDEDDLASPAHNRRYKTVTGLLRHIPVVGSRSMGGRASVESYFGERSKLAKGVKARPVTPRHKTEEGEDKWEDDDDDDDDLSDLDVDPALSGSMKKEDSRDGNESTVVSSQGSTE